MRKTKKYRVLSLFSGAGGMDLGLIQAGLEIVWANDFFKEACETYSLNIGDIVYGDITKISSKEMPNNIDIVVGGFPCQGFSVANTKRSMKDKRNFLYLEMLRVIKDKKPKIFIAENVKGITNIENGEVIEMIIKDFESLGYKVDYRLLNAAEFGVPQQRERIIIMGNRLGVENIFPKQTHWLYEKDKNKKIKPSITCKEAIGWLSNIRLSYKPIRYKNKTIYNHIASTNVADTFWGRKYKVNQHDICDYLKYWRDKAGWTTSGVDNHFGYAYTAGHWFRKDNNSGSIPSPEDWWELKRIFKFDNKYDKQVTTIIEKPITYEQSLRITNWDRPSDTITATSPEIHVNKKRRLSVRECAILQTFPDDFVFTGSLSRMYTQVGNAVPVLLAKKIGKCAIKMLNSK